jgi:hypothetical protein
VARASSSDKPPTLPVLIEQGLNGKRFVAVAAGWAGLERGAKQESEAIEKLVTYLPRYALVAKRAGLDRDFEARTEPKVIDRYTGTGSTDFWGISFAPSPLDREPYDKAAFGRQVALLEAVWAEFDATVKRVTGELKLGPRGGGRERDHVIRHVLANEGEEFAKRVGVPTDRAALETPKGITAHRKRFVDAMRAWYEEDKPLGKWTVPYLLRHTAYHALDHAWELQDRDPAA